MTRNTRERSLPWCACCVLHHQHFPWPHEHRGRSDALWKLLHPIHHFTHFPSFFPFPSFVFHKQEAKGHFHLLISHIRRTSKRSFAYTVYLRRSESVSFIESSALKSYYPGAAQLTYRQLLAPADISFGSNIHDINRYSRQSPYVL